MKLIDLIFVSLKLERSLLMTLSSLHQKQKQIHYYCTLLWLFVRSAELGSLVMAEQLQRLSCHGARMD